MLEPNLFNTVLIFPILNLLIAMYKGFLFLKIPGAYGLAIVSLTVLVRLVLHPFFDQQMQTAKKMQDVKPHMDKISAKHKKDPKKLQQEQMRLYKEFGINPASGCLFMVIQIPIFISLYNTLSLVLSNGNGASMIASINKVLYSPALHIDKIDPWFLGLNLALSPAKAGVWYYYALPVITAVLQYLQAKTTMMPGASSAVVENKDIKKDGDKKEKHGGDDFQKAMNTQMKFIFPLMIGYFSYTLPVGLSLYWNIFSLFSIMQYRKLKAAKK